MSVNINIDGNAAAHDIAQLFKKEKRHHLSIIEVFNRALNGLHFEAVYFDEDSCTWYDQYSPDAHEALKYDTINKKPFEEVLAVEGEDRASGLISFVYRGGKDTINDAPRYRILFFFYNSLHSGNRVAVKIQNNHTTRRYTNNIGDFLKEKFKWFEDNTNKYVYTAHDQLGTIIADCSLGTDGDENHLHFKLEVSWL